MSRCNKVCSHPKRAEIDDMLAHNTSYTAIARAFPGLSRDSVRNYVRSGCPNGDLSLKQMLKENVKNDNEKRIFSGLSVVQGVLDDISRRLANQPSDELNQSIVAATRVQLEAAKMLGVESQTEGKSAISDYMCQLRAEEDQYQEKK